MWQTLSQYWQRSFENKVIVVLSTAVLIAILVSVIGGYAGGWTWVGVADYSPSPDKSADAERGKTLWNWMELLFLPVALAVFARMLTRIEKNREEERKRLEQRRQANRVRLEQRRQEEREQLERALEQDRQCEAALQKYLDQMRELLLDRGLRKSQPEDDVRAIARTLTIVTMRRLNGKRNETLLRFLGDAGLLEKDEPVIHFQEADLSRIDLRQTNLPEIDFSKAILKGSHLEKASLMEAHLEDAIMYEVHMEEANLYQAHLEGANLFDAHLERASLRGAHLEGASLRGAHLEGASLLEANLEGADLAGAGLSGTGLISANLRGANLRGSNLHEADLIDITFDDQTAWPEGFTPPPNAIKIEE